MTNKASYRPVSVLTALSKIYENVMFDQMYDAFHWRLSPNLSGYLKGHSFDSVCHPLLLAKLKAYGFTDDALELMTAYLLGRRQRSIFSAENYNNRSTIGILVKSTLI